jgi:hypothetical protein
MNQQILENEVRTLLNKVNREQKKEIVLAIIKLTFKKILVADEIVARAIRAIEQENVNNELLKKELEIKVEELDDAAIDVQGGWIEDNSIKYDEERYANLFSQARAVNVLLNAVNLDVQRVAYEAGHAIGDFSLIKNVISDITVIQ